MLEAAGKEKETKTSIKSKVLRDFWQWLSCDNFSFLGLTEALRVPIKTQPQARDQAYTFSSLIWVLAEIVFPTILPPTPSRFSKVQFFHKTCIVISMANCIFATLTRYFAINFTWWCRCSPTFYYYLMIVILRWSCKWHPNIRFYEVPWAFKRAYISQKSLVVENSKVWCKSKESIH